FLCFLLIPPPTRSTLFPYTTLFRSIRSIRYSGYQQSFKLVFPEVTPVEFITELVEVILQVFWFYLVIHAQELSFGIADRGMHPGQHLGKILVWNNRCRM